MVSHYGSFADAMRARRRALVFMRAIALGFMRLDEARGLDEDIAFIDACLMFADG